ncbi:hypothetical protein ZIOFF_024200 [Zingiber officinale]|uniref:Reverse transcriptase Ty1/copia-type domain-containing protein n=1 Tax=Zingiber officinale TaxID=94328 RepID=A0A8J5GT75_ZINOF|nr:hypothetical protein ZIOFF_024200 [Zingiber officinale]
MMTEFEMSDLGLLSYYLGIEVEQQKSRILLRQSAYAKKILSQFKMADCNATKHPMEPKTQLHKDLERTPVGVTEYRRIIGCLRYLLHTRSDLSYFVGMASRYIKRPTIMYHKMVKQMLRYLKDQDAPPPSHVAPVAIVDADSCRPPEPFLQSLSRVLYLCLSFVWHSPISADDATPAEQRRLPLSMSPSLCPSTTIPRPLQPVLVRCPVDHRRLLVLEPCPRPEPTR